jgi:tripartite-type tricarboxylate transporter receptor subunit TctC
MVASATAPAWAQPTTTAAAASSYPDRPVRIVITTTAGGPADLVARTMGAKLAERLGAQFVVEAKPGANGIIATESVAKAAPDGYILLLTTGSHAINPAVYKKPPYDSVKDFEPVAQPVAPGPFVLVGHPSVGATGVAELLALGKKTPLTYASAGIGNTSHLGGEMLEQLSGAKLNHVPYKGMSQAINDVLAGQVQLMFNAWPLVERFVQEGKLKAFAQTGPKRSPAIPGLPTLIEVGVAGYELTGWYVLLAPARTPREVIDKLNSHVVAAMAMPDVRGRLGAMAAGEPPTFKPAEVAAFIRAETQRMEKLARAAGISLDAGQ